MPFSQENQRWILDQIREAMYPNGFKRVANWLRHWTLLGVGVTVIIGLIAAVITLAVATVNRASVEAEFRGTTRTKLDGIDKRLGDIEQGLLALRVARAASSPANEKNISEAKALLSKARDSAIKLPTDVVKDSGVAFIEAAAIQPAAWNTAVDFLNYRSSLNVYVRPVNTIPLPTNAETHFELGPPINDKPLPKTSHVPFAVAPKDAARFETIGRNASASAYRKSILPGAALPIGL